MFELWTEEPDAFVKHIGDYSTFATARKAAKRFEHQSVNCYIFDRTSKKAWLLAEGDPPYEMDEDEAKATIDSFTGVE